MTEPEWLDVNILLDVHAEQLVLFGGPDGVRDLGLLESALARPMNKFAYGETDLAALAAAYGFGIARNHPFVGWATKRRRSRRSSCFSALTVSIWWCHPECHCHDPCARGQRGTREESLAHKSGQLAGGMNSEWNLRWINACPGTAAM